MSIDHDRLFISDYVNEIIHRSRGMPESKLSEFRDAIKKRLATFEWLLTGMDTHVLSVVIQTGDMFLKDEPNVALDLFREASFLFPRAAICYVKQAQCEVKLVNFNQAKKSCRKAIRLSGVDRFEELLSLIGQFVIQERLREAHDLYVCLMDRFPNDPCIVKYGVVEKIKELKTLLINKAKEDKKNIAKHKIEEKPSKLPSGKVERIGKNIDQTSIEKLHVSKASGEYDECEKVDVNQSAGSAKPKAKTSRQLKREQFARDKMIENEIAKAVKKHEEERKKQEVKECKRQEREIEHLRKQQEIEDKKRLEELEKLGNKETNEHSRKRTSRKPDTNKDMNAQSTQTKNSSSNLVLPGKGHSSLNDMPTVFDHVLSTGTIVRCFCPKCKNPRLVSKRNCHSCESELVLWCQEVGTSNWTQPRKAPKDVPGSYQHCKYFLKGKQCVKAPCTFAHGQDELEIWTLCRKKSMYHESSLAEYKTPAALLPKFRSSVNNDSGLSSQYSNSQSLSGTFEMQSSGDMFGGIGSLFHSQDLFDESSQNSNSGSKSTSSLSSDEGIDVYYADDDSTNSSQFSTLSQSTLSSDESDDGWTTVGSNKGNLGIKKKKSPETCDLSATNRQDFVSVVLDQEKSRCNFCDAKFSSPLQLQYHYSHVQHKANIMKRYQEIVKSAKKFRQPPEGVYMGHYKLCRRFEQGYCYFDAKCTFAHGREELEGWRKFYKRRVQNLAQLEEKRLLTKSFSEKVRLRIQNEGPDVLKDDLPGVTVECSSDWRMKLDEPQSHVWKIDVQIQTKHRPLCSEVAFLLETHLDKFTFLSGSEGNCTSNVQSLLLYEEDFVKDFTKQESAIQFRIQFSSKVFGVFKQTLVFDFDTLVLARSLDVSVVSKDVDSSKEDSSSRTSRCHILEWSEKEMELVKCEDLIEIDLDGLCDQYSIPVHVSLNPAECAEFTRETYCKLWHDILFIEEKYIQEEVARYDIFDGKMKILDRFQNASETVFAQSGEFFGEVYLSDYVVMDEVAGNLISRSVMSVILRLKLGQTQSNRIYECSIKKKNSHLVVIKLNEELCQEYVFEKDQSIYIDLKFRYNRIPICEMHQTIDRSQEKTEILLPNVKNVFYKRKKSFSDWFMDKKPNTNQHEAIAMILDPSPTPPILVIGPFGTGKTFTLNLACVSILSQSERNKVLICTHSNSAADIHLQHLDTKILEKPVLHIRPLRVLNIFRRNQTVAENLRRYCLIEEETGAVKEPRWGDIDGHNVIITTLASARMLWKFYQDGRLRFTHILIDEAAQALEPECVTPLVMADGNTKIVLAGDHKQMGATAYSKCLWPDDFGPKRSLLERLFAHYKQYTKTLSQLSPSSDDDSTTSLQTPYVVLLTENYRCHAKILKFPSDCFYGGALIASGDQDTHDSIPVLSFYTAQGVDQRVEGSLAYYNEAEVAEVVKQVEELVQLWPKHWGKKDIGVLTPYHDQVKRIRDGLRRKHFGFVDVETVENVQGKEFKVLFISTVRTMWTCSQIECRNAELNSDLSELDFGFLSNPRFLNTAVTRAQSLLAVVGDPMSLCSIGACRNLWKDYLQRCDANKGLYGCTLKIVMDFCLSSQVLDPSAHEFIPLKDGRIELGFNVKESDRLFRLTGGNLLPKEKGDNQYGHDIETSPEELIELLSQAGFTKCSFRVDTSVRPPGYCGRLPTPDSPDIKILSPVRAVYEGDVVVLEIQTDTRTRDKKDQRKETAVFGYIRGILRRLIEPRERQFVCTVDRANQGMMNPINKKLPKLANFIKTDEDIIPIYTMEDGEVSEASILNKHQRGEALAGERVFVVKFLRWRPDCPHPLGLAVRHIPCGKDFKSGMEILYEEHNVRRKFDKELCKKVTKEFTENWQVPTSEQVRRLYCKNVFTIDPAESMDLDDAISVKSLGNGNFDFHIHIADVSYFVKPNTKLDKEARLRCTSYYPPKPEVTVPILPPELSEGCCSLLKGEDRLAVTVSVELTSDGRDVGDVRIERSLVRSSSRLTYREAQQIIDETRLHDLPVNQEEKQVPVRKAIGIIHRIAQRRRRLRLGIEGSLYNRQTDDHDWDESDESEQEAHQMIEELMIMTNHLIAKYLLKKFPKRTPLRVQRPPKDSDIKEWRKCFNTILNFTLELKLLGDAKNTLKETAELKVPYETWSMIMSQVNQDSDFQVLVKLVCDFDLFPQLALANLKQKLLQQRPQYICSGETFENISFSSLQHEKEVLTKKQTGRTQDSMDRLDDNVNFSTNNKNLPHASQGTADETSSRNTNPVDATDNVASPLRTFLNDADQCSVNVSGQQNLNNIFYGHSSLCLDAYCHFTSPIRRYIDIIVHRLVVSGIENKDSTMEPDEITTICDRCTFFAGNTYRFNKDAKKLHSAVKLEGSFRFVSSFIEAIEPDALRLFFGTGEFEILNSKPLHIARLGPDRDPQQEKDGQISLQWTFRVLLTLDQRGHAQNNLPILDEKLKERLGKIKDEIPLDTSEATNDNFDYVVTGEQWNRVLDVIKNKNKDQLKSQLQNVDDVFQKQKRPVSSTKIFPLKTSKEDESTESTTDESTEEDTEMFVRVIRSFKPFDRVKVQMCSEIDRGFLSPTIQLYMLTDNIHICVEHRSSPITCFAKTAHKRPTDTQFSDITEYVQLWKPVLMMEIAKSAVRDDNVVALSNLFVRFARDAEDIVTVEFDLSNEYCEDHSLDSLDLNLMCVRIKDPNGSGKDTGYWVGHFQISETLMTVECAGESTKEAEGILSFQDDQNTCSPIPVLNISDPSSWLEAEDVENKSKYKTVLARLIQSSSPVPESLMTQELCCATVELISLSIPDRRRLGALVNSVGATELVQDICTGKVSTECDVEGSSIPKKLSLCDIYPSLPIFRSEPLNSYQEHAVQKALSRSFTLIQGPPGTGKTITGVHIAHHFVQLNRESGKNSMVLYCGRSNKSVDVVARYLMTIPEVKILRIYGQEIERKDFPVPDKVTLFCSKHVPEQHAAEQDLDDIALHRVIRSAESPFANMLAEYDAKFKNCKKRKVNAPRKMIKAFKRLKSVAENWAITQRGVNVILATCTTAYSPRIMVPCKDLVSQCIIDECGMCIEAETICAMLGSNAKQFVLIGDHKQLQPVIKCNEAKDLGLGISMFERFSKQALMLKIQYRMHENLCQFPSDFFYDGELVTAKEVKEREPDKVTWPNGERYPFEFHHVEGIEESLVVSTKQGNEKSKKNKKEVDRVVYVARRLTNDGIKGEDIVVLSPYRAQCFEITKKLKQHNLNNISVMSVVAAQGREKNYVILSLVRSLPEKEIERNPSRSWLMEKLGFITDEHQINVALTRAKRGLSIVGNANLIRACSIWKKLLKHYEEKGCLLKEHLSFSSPIFQGFPKNKNGENNEELKSTGSGRKVPEDETSKTNKTKQNITQEKAKKTKKPRQIHKDIHEESEIAWFEDTFIDQKHNLKKDVHEKIRSFSWMSGAYGLIGPNKKIRRPHLFLTVKKGVKKSDARREIKDKFSCDPRRYFELLREPERKPQIKYLGDHVNDGSRASTSTPSLRAAPGGGVLACTINSSNPLRVPEENENEEKNKPDEQGTGTLTMFCSPGGQHYALTCFHVGCACDENRLSAAFNRVEDIQNIRNCLKKYVNYAQKQQYYFTNRYSGSEQNGNERNNNESITFGYDECPRVCLGDFADYHFDTECDILSLKVSNDIKFNCKLPDVIYPNMTKMWTELNKVLKSQTQVVVEKFGFSSALTYGRIVISNFNYMHEHNLLFQDAIVVEGFSVPFLKGGDSGCLVYIRDVNDQKIAFAYGVCEVDALHLPEKHVPTSSTASDDDASSDEDSYEDSSSGEIDAELKCNLETEDQVECEDEFKLGTAVHRVAASSIDSVGDASGEGDSSAGENDAELKFNVEAEDQAKCIDEFEFEYRGKKALTKECGDKQKNALECAIDGERKSEHEDGNKDENGNAGEVNCGNEHENASDFEFEDDDNYDNDETRKHEGDWFRVEFQDKDDDNDDQSSESIIFEDVPTGPYFICLRLDTALEKLDLDDAGCFNDCGSE